MQWISKQIVGLGEDFHSQVEVLRYTMREVAVSEYYSEGPKAAIWLMDFEYPQFRVDWSGEVRTEHVEMTEFEGS